MAIKEGAIIGGKFRLERPLAQGGMGSVWVARHQLLDTDVAVKFMEKSIAENELARVRFEREAKAAVLIKSPHVVQVFDYGIDDGSPYIAMELLDGEDLDHRLERGPLDLERTYRILEQLGKALRRAHELGIVHRDLKPGNIFLARHGDEELVKILDFGIAKDINVTGSASATSTGALLGSPSYMSPEQIRETKLVDQRSDLWSIGVILYEMITGRLPFDETENIGKLLVSICTDPFILPSVLVPSLGVEVDRFFEKALTRDMNGRFQSMTELVDAFGACAGIGPSRALRISGELPAPRASSLDRTMEMDKTLLDEPAVAKSADRGAAPRLDVPETRSSLEPAESVSRGGSSRKKFVPIVLAVGGLLALGGVAFALRRSADAPKTPAVEPASKPAQALAPVTTLSPSPSIAMAGAVREVRVAIEPADATVEVEGRVVAVDSTGFVTISGELGSVHPVRVYKDKLEEKKDVIITAKGPLPDKMVLPGDKKPAPTQPAVVTTTPVKMKEPVPTATAQLTPPPTTAKTVTKPPPGDPNVDRDFK